MIYKGRYLSEEVYTIIEDTVMDIPQRLKQIDPGYFLVLNKQKDRYEVHHVGNRGGTYCLICPYDGLDSRLLDYVEETKSENARKLFAKMDADNEKRERDSKNQAADYIGEVAKDIYKFAKQDHKHRECRLDKVVTN